MRYLLLVLLFCTSLNAQGYRPDNCIEAAVRVNQTQSSCGTIIKVVRNGNRSLAYIISTGHMLERNEPKIEIFYLNSKKLKKPLLLRGKTLLVVENNFGKGVDFCLIECDIEEKDIPYIPLAPADFSIPWNKNTHSCGCDMGIVPKRFAVKPLKSMEDRLDFEAEGESLAGRSGGGVFTSDHKYLIGVHWGSTLGPNRHCLVTSFTAIRKTLAAVGFDKVID